jgi:hypothetical protein
MNVNGKQGLEMRAVTLEDAAAAPSLWGVQDHLRPVRERSESRRGSSLVQAARLPDPRPRVTGKLLEVGGKRLFVKGVT